MTREQMIDEAVRRVISKTMRAWLVDTGDIATALAISDWPSYIRAAFWIIAHREAA